jgi:hypothetical protein
VSKRWRGVKGVEGVRQVERCLGCLLSEGGVLLVEVKVVVESTRQLVNDRGMETPAGK